jgi:hypothetical protein
MTSQTTGVMPHASRVAAALLLLGLQGATAVFSGNSSSLVSVA